MAVEAMAFMERNRDKPFFLNYWMFRVHAPFDAKQSLIDKYRQSVDPHDPQRSPTYAAMVESMDDAIGSLLDTLDRLEIADNTIVIFASDNGGNMYNEVDGTSATSNTPLRGGKATLYEGGIRTPAVIIAPEVTKPNSRCDEIIQSCDYYPTILELLAIAPQVDQVFDGVSLVPALQATGLQTAALDRAAIFTYFPHSPGVPDWLPPSIACHQGDWKLIRIFFGGEDGKHRWKLFNLRDDIGETHDLAMEFPEQVHTMDLQIEDFLAQTSAVQPIVNPNFDPASYDLDKEGRAKLKGSRNPVATKPPNQSPNQEVAGWQPGGTCSLSKIGEALVVDSTGGDPHISYRLPRKIEKQALKLHLTMRSDSAGSVQLFWHETGVAPAFHRDRSQIAEFLHDGQSHEVVISFTPHHPIQSLRLDPSGAKGKVEIFAWSLLDATGKVLHHQKFDE